MNSPRVAKSTDSSGECYSLKWRMSQMPNVTFLRGECYNLEWRMCPLSSKCNSLERRMYPLDSKMNCLEWRDEQFRVAK